MTLKKPIAKSTKKAPTKKSNKPHNPTLADALDEITELKEQGACIPTKLGVTIVMPHERTHHLKSEVGTAFFMTYEEFAAVCGRVLMAQMGSSPELMDAHANSLAKSTVAH